ncbi:MAG: hypothetical protein U0974_03880 [Gemmatimonadales bacterium]|nr:hypothetical protein [Gemmatimonadales bacterium]
MPESSRPWASWRFLWMALYLGTLAGAAWYFRFAPVPSSERSIAPSVLDRWKREVCYQRGARLVCLPLSTRTPWPPPP